MNRIKVCWISNEPSPYKVEFMNLLGQQVDLICLFEQANSQIREKEWYNYNFSFFKGVYLKENSTKIIRKYANECDCLINSDYSNPMCIYASFIFRLKHKIVFIHADGGLVIKRGILIDNLIGLVMRNANYYLSSGEEVDKYFKYYGVKEDKINTYRFTSFSKSEIDENQKLIHKKDDLRHKLGITEKFVLLSIGQQVPRKGFDILTKAMVGVSSDVGLYIAGGNPEENVKEIIEKYNLSNIHFVGFKNKKELMDYYSVADIFVLTTRYDIWGLVINEAMSFSLPIISTDKCVAAVQFNNIKKNAIIVPIEDVNATHEAIEYLINDEEKRTEMGKNSFDIIKDYTLENMCYDFVSILNNKVKLK